ncbi:MAG: DMT family transporter [bacterium]|nr:DMT family transporter [bacterium]
MKASRQVEIGAILLLTAIWGSAFAFIKIALEAFTPWQLVLARFIPTIPIFLWISWRHRDTLLTLTKMEWLKLTIAGLSATALYNIALNTGETRVGAGLASLVISLNPAFIIGGAILFRGEKVSKRFFLGAGVSFLGVIILTLSRNRFGFDTTALTGVFVILLCPFSWALYTLLIHDVAKRAGSMAAPAVAVVIGTVLLLPTYPFTFPDRIPTDIVAWSCVAFLGLASTVIGFSLWSWLLKHRGAARTGMVVYLNVVWGVFFAWLVLDEVIAWNTILGAAFILTGVAISRRSS